MLESEDFPIESSSTEVDSVSNYCGSLFSLSCCTEESMDNMLGYFEERRSEIGSAFEYYAWALKDFWVTYNEAKNSILSFLAETELDTYIVSTYEKVKEMMESNKEEESNLSLCRENLIKFQAGIICVGCTASYDEYIYQGSSYDGSTAIVVVPSLDDCSTLAEYCSELFSEMNFMNILAYNIYVTLIQYYEGVTNINYVTLHDKQRDAINHAIDGYTDYYSSCGVDGACEDTCSWITQAFGVDALHTTGTPEILNMATSKIVNLAFLSCTDKEDCDEEDSLGFDEETEVDALLLRMNNVKDSIKRDTGVHLESKKKSKRVLEHDLEIENDYVGYVEFVKGYPSLITLGSNSKFTIEYEMIRSDFQI